VVSQSEIIFFYIIKTLYIFRQAMPSSGVHGTVAIRVDDRHEMALGDNFLNNQ
jgi:hypothetical protein